MRQTARTRETQRVITKDELQGILSAVIALSPKQRLDYIEFMRVRQLLTPKEHRQSGRCLPYLKALVHEYQAHDYQKPITPYGALQYFKTLTTKAFIEEMSSNWLFPVVLEYHSAYAEDLANHHQYFRRRTLYPLTGEERRVYYATAGGVMTLNEIGRKGFVFFSRIKARILYHVDWDLWTLAYYYADRNGLPEVEINFLDLVMKDKRTIEDLPPDIAIWATRYLNY